MLKDWLVSEGLIEADRSGSWKLGDGRLRREADDDDDDDDAEDEDDEETGNLRRTVKLEGLKEVISSGTLYVGYIFWVGKGACRKARYEVGSRISRQRL